MYDTYFCVLWFFWLVRSLSSIQDFLNWIEIDWNDPMQAVIVQLTEQLSQARKDLEFSCDEFTAQLGEQEDALKRSELEIAKIQQEASSTMIITKDRLAELQQINQQQQVSLVTGTQFFVALWQYTLFFALGPFQLFCTRSQTPCNMSRVTMPKWRPKCTLAGS